VLNPGTLFILERDMGQCLHPRHWGLLDKEIMCTVISGAQVAFGTKGATNRYLVLGDERLLTVELIPWYEVRLRILVEPK